MKEIEDSESKLKQARDDAKRAIEDAGGIWNEAEWGLGSVEQGLRDHKAIVLKPYEQAQVQLNEAFDGLIRKYLGHALYEFGTAEAFCTRSNPLPPPVTSLLQ